MSLADPRQRRAQVLAQLEPPEGRAGSSRFSLWGWGRQELFGATLCPPCVCPFPGIAHPWDEPWQEAAVPRRALAVPALVCGITEVSSSCFPPKKKTPLEPSQLSPGAWLIPGMPWVTLPRSFWGVLTSSRRFLIHPDPSFPSRDVPQISHPFPGAPGILLPFPQLANPPRPPTPAPPKPRGRHRVTENEWGEEKLGC